MSSRSPALAFPKFWSSHDDRIRLTRSEVQRPRDRCKAQKGECRDWKNMSDEQMVWITRRAEDESCQAGPRPGCGTKCSTT
jgi:hypothetical protein